MKKSIELKSVMKVDKNGMKKILAGSCAQYGVVCTNVYAKPVQKVLEGAAAADKLWLG